MSADQQAPAQPPAPALPPLPRLDGLTQPQVEQIQRDAQRTAQEEMAKAVEQLRRAQQDLARQRIGRDGRIVIAPRDGGFQFPPPPQDVIPEGAIILGIGFFAACVVTIVGLPIARAFARRMDRKAVAAPAEAETHDRLERIEQAVDTIALEVERISEGQRYTSQIMSELRALPAPNPLANGSPISARRGEPVDR
jgi:hypothetical protein